MASDVFYVPFLAVGPIQPPIQWMSGIISPGVKRPGPEADHSPPSRPEVKNGESIPPSLRIFFHGIMLNQLSAGTTLPYLTTLIQEFEDGN
jgi:hypothetical protein